MKHPIVVGLQFGDEGKGKITDLLAEQAQHVIRFNGGNNAGHSLHLNGKKLVTHSVPSGVLYPKVKNFIGAGCVVDPMALDNEIKDITSAGVTLLSDRLKIDYRAHLIFPIHKALDGAREAGPQGIGTTKRGIGPTYMTKCDRLGIRAADLYSSDAKEKVRILCQTYNPLLRALNLPESGENENFEVLAFAKNRFKDFVSFEEAPFYERARSEKCVLEGAQAVLLDVDHGNYPYVTSSNTLAPYACVGTPFPLSRLGLVLGVAKAYLTRVGLGPFPTELNNEDGERIRKVGHEYGATTGRPRRTGWLNLDELRIAVRLSDCSALVLTKGDVLNGESKVGFLKNSKLEFLPGWKQLVDASGHLDANFEAFAKVIEDHIGIPLIAAGCGADRNDIVWRVKVADFWSGKL